MVVELEKQYPHGGHVEWTWVCAKSRYPPSGSIPVCDQAEEMRADNDDDSDTTKDQTHGSLYHLYPAQKLQLNLNSKLLWPMRRIAVLDQ